MDGRTSMKIAWGQLMLRRFSFNILLTLFELQMFFYGNDDDAYTIPSSLKDYITLLYIEQVPLYE